ncbi:DUF2752 domain-containing protein [Labilibacter sediminis]|nr:DUF2752 domain-containing protein [Labilibacter sediminis]
MHKRIKLHRSHLEGFIWIAALLCLMISDPYESNHYSLCILKNNGFSFCPGCGLGHSISFLFRGNVTASFNSHPLGIFAIVILGHRIFKIFTNNLSST